MNGFCYLIPADLQTANIRKLPAMVGARRRTAYTSWGQLVYNFGMAGMGASLHITKEVRTIQYITETSPCKSDPKVAPKI